MAKVCEVVEVMDDWAPTQIAESWDNVGLITGNFESEIQSVIITLETTEKTLVVAQNNQPSMIISHHPPIFKPIKNLISDNLTTKVICTAVKETIPLYASHTNLDQAPDGVSYALAEKLGLTRLRTLAPGNCDLFKFVTFAPPEHIDRIREAAGRAGAGIIGEYSLCSFTSKGTGTYIPSRNASPYEGKTGELSRVHEDRIEMVVPSFSVSQVLSAVRKVHPYEEIAYDLIFLGQKDIRFGYGAVGELEKPLSATEFIYHVSSSLGIETVYHSLCNKTTIHHVAVMGGSGRDYIGQALSSGADAYVTGEIGYHNFLENGDAILLVDASHRATELPVLTKIQERLQTSSALKDIHIIIDWGEPPQSVMTHKINIHD